MIPERGDIVIFDGEYGHVAISDGVSDNKYMFLYEQNFASNKFGDALSEDPKATKQLVQRAVRVPGLNLAGPLIDAYYASKAGESEKKKLDRELGYE